MKKMTTVSLCMIVKNEERHLGRCLQSVKDLVDEIIIIDTGSSDNTVEIAKEYGATVGYWDWNDNFSDARNYSIKNARMDWLLFMDADDEFHKEDIPMFIDLLNHSQKDGHYFKTLSYAGSHIGNDIVTNLNLRLLRNNGKYRFTGAIHEQITCSNGPMDYSNFTSEEIRIFHYGYLNNVAAEKNKRKRNIDIIEKELEQDPHNSFHYFNLGNEYFALGDLTKALELYNKAYQDIAFHIGFASKLVFKRILCMDELGRYEPALQAIEEGLQAYPEFTDLEFERGWNHLKNQRFTLAIESFSRCIQMGKPPVQLEFMEGCGTYRSYEALGEIHYQLQDYTKAYSYFENALQQHPYLQKPLYKIGAILNKLYSDKRLVSYKLSQHFNLDHLPNLLLISDILIQESLYDLAKGYLEKAKDLDPVHPQTNYLTARVLFYQKEYSDALALFVQLPANSEELIESMRFIFLCQLLIKNADLSLFFNTPSLDPVSKNIYLQLFYIYTDNDTVVLHQEDDQALQITTVMSILSELLRLREFILFEKLLTILNLIESNKVLLELAKLYDDQGFGKMAVYEVLRSIKELNTIDAYSAKILCREIR